MAARKQIMIGAAVWTATLLLAGLAGVWRIHTHPIPGVPQELRAAKLGLQIGALTATGIALGWLGISLSARKKPPEKPTDTPETPTD